MIRNLSVSVGRRLVQVTNRKFVSYIRNLRSTCKHVDYTVTAGCSLSSLLLFLPVFFSFSFSFLTNFPSHCFQKTDKSCCTLYLTGSRAWFFL